jgi:hypothetical protein
MPLKRRYGFIFLDNNNSIEQQVYTIAHELGHGAFRLRHTFSEHPTLTKGTTNNLMDYSDSTHLFKYQWDYIHDPEMVIAWLEEEDEGALFKYNWVFIDSPELFRARKALKYIAVDAKTFNDWNGTLYLMEDNKTIFYEGEDFQKEWTTEVNTVYKIYIEEINKWTPVYLSDYETNCLSCDLRAIGKEFIKLSGKTVGRYILPAEDFHILVTGENFDGEESSRIAAGGFIILEAIQVGKVYKIIKGAKLLTKGGKTINASKRIIKHFAKEVYREALIDMSVQFFINFVYESVDNPNLNGHDIAAKSFANINTKDALISGIIDYTSINKKTKNYFDCAKNILRRLEDGGTKIEIDLKQGALDCFIILAVRYSFDKLGSKDYINKLINKISESKNYDVILSNLSEILSADAVDKFIIALTENSIIRETEPQNN